MDWQVATRMILRIAAVSAIPIIILVIILIFSGSSGNETPKSENSQHSQLQSAKVSLWPGARIPYTVDPYMDDSKILFEQAFKIFHEKTCLKFIPKEDSDENWITFSRDDSLCFESELGLDNSIKGSREIQFGLDCLRVPVIQKSLGRMIGLDYEETRPDRDKFIRYNDDCKAEIEKTENISTVSVGEYNEAAFNILFDYTSHMLKDDECIEPLLGGKIKLGSSDSHTGTFSVLDIEKINAIYNCPGCNSYRFLSSQKVLEGFQHFVSFKPVVGGYNIDNTPMYVCRVYHHGSILIGKLWLQEHENFCWVSNNVSEFRYGRRYEVMTNPKGAKLNWQPLNDTNKIPNNAVPGGRTVDRQTLYIGRCRLQRGTKASLIPSSILPGVKVFKVPYYHLAHPCSPIEILVCDE